MPSTQATADTSLSELFDQEQPQLAYILEYVTRNPEFSLPNRSVHDLLSLVCEEPSQPVVVPPYLLAAGCLTIFSENLADTYFEEAFSAIEQLDRMETIRKRYRGSLLRSPHLAGKAREAEKTDREVSKMFDFTSVALRRWTFINEVHTAPFKSTNCLALINILFPSTDHGQMAKERTMATVILQKVKKALAAGRLVRDCQILQKYEANISWRQAHTALQRYLDAAQTMIAKIEGIIDPIPAEVRQLGIKREDCVLHRISKHLIATNSQGFEPELSAEEDQESHGGQNRSTSPEL